MVTTLSTDHRMNFDAYCQAIKIFFLSKNEIKLPAFQSPTKNSIFQSINSHFSSLLTQQLLITATILEALTENGRN